MDINLPRLSFVLFSFNQERYIRDALYGALSQTYSPLEIIITDDCSSDRTFEIAKEIVAKYSGPHTIILNRNEKNMGVANHINKAMQLAKGDLILMAAADDISLPERAELTYKEWMTSGRVYKSIFSNVELIDEFGNVSGKMFTETPIYSRCIKDFIKRSRAKNRKDNTPKCWVLGCSQVIDRSLFDIYGPLNSNILQEDGAISFRALLQGEIKYIDKPLVLYRRHSINTFKPGNIKSVLRLLKSEYYYKRSWLKDATLTNSQDKELMRVLVIEHQKSLMFHKIYNFPFLGKSILYLKRFVKWVINYKGGKI